MRLAIGILSLFFIATVQADVYKHTGKDGSASFSDTPSSGAKKIVVPPVMTYTPPKIEEQKEEAAQAIGEEADNTRIPYQQLLITYPENNGTVRSNQGELKVAYTIAPSLQLGDKVELMLDGERREGMNVGGLHRGEHTVQVQVVNEAGKIQKSSSPVVFHLHHHSQPLRKSPR